MLFYLLLALVWLLSYLYLLKPCFRPKDFPPGPVNFPLAGAFPHIGSDMIGFFKRSKEQFGKIWSFNMGSDPVVVIADYELFKEISTRPEFLGRPKNLPGLDNMFPDAHRQHRGVMFSTGEEWRQLRRFTLRSLKDFGFGRDKSMGPLIAEEVETLVELIRKHNVGKPSTTLDATFMNVPIINSLWRILTGERMSRSDNQFNRVIKAMTAMLTSVGTVSPLQVFPFLKHIAPEMSGYNLLMGSANEVYTLLDEQRSAHALTLDTEHPRDLVDAFLSEAESSEASKYFKGETGRRNFLVTLSNLFAGGSDTTGTTLKWALHFLSKNPEVQQRCRDEILQVVGSNRLPCGDDRALLPYTEAVVHEVSRVASLGYTGVPRMTTEEAKVAGYVIPKDTMVFVDIYWMLRDPKHWEDPASFDPTRFLDPKTGAFRQSNYNVTFGLGKRDCIGKSVALNQLFHFIAGLVQNFEFSLPEEEKDKVLKPIQGFVLGCPEYRICIEEVK